MRSTDRDPNNQADEARPDITAEMAEALRDDEEIIVDGFHRLSVFGLEVAMLDGPIRVRTLASEPRREDRRRRRRPS